TMFKDIFCLQPGHTLTLEGSRIEVRQYWDLRFSGDSTLTEEEAVAQLQERLEESVRLRFIAEVPLGGFLSGGFDATAVLVLTCRLAGDRVKTFSVGYEGTGSDEKEASELDYARVASQAFHSEHHEYRLTAAEFQEFIPDMAWHLDQPMADPSCIP